MDAIRITEAEWYAAVDRDLARIDYDRTSVGMHRQPWAGWFAQGLAPCAAVREACADLCISYQDGEYSTAYHAARDAAHEGRSMSAPVGVARD